MNTIDANILGLVSAASPRQSAQKGDRERFTDLMRVSFDRQGEAAESREKQLKAAANQLVSVAFIKPLMAQMRQNPFKNEMFHGGPGEEMFQEHLDTVLADRLAARSNFSLADAIYRKMAKLSGMDPQSSPSGPMIRMNQHG